VSTNDETTHTRLYAGGKVIAEDFPASEATAQLDQHPDAVLWLGLLNPSPDQMQAVATAFHLHPLAVEDALAEHERPKLDRYRHHLFMNVYQVQVETENSPELTKHEISAFITERALITVRKSETDITPLLDRWDSEPELAVAGGVSYLVYGLLDLIVDGQYAAAQRLDEVMDKTEDVLLAEGGAPRNVRRYGFGLRRTIAELRRPVSPMPDLIAQVLRSDSQLMVDHLAPYFRDVDDHAQQATNTIDGARDRINGLLEADLNEQSNQLNDITRKLAAWAAIIAVPTALTGFFGQNVPYPGYERISGFIVSSVLLVFSAGGLYLYLKRRGWL
jgi:magnesium transporter